MNVVIVANGIIEDHTGSRMIAEMADLLLCADGGARHVLQWGMTPHVVIGDMDSLDDETLARLASAGVELVRHPAQKDATDLELALEWGIDSGATEITILGALGGRMDHVLGNILLLAHPRLAGIPARIHGNDEWLTLVRDRLTILGNLGDTVSLLPLCAEVTHVTTTGLEYPLQDESLRYSFSRGISNRLIEREATITLGEGLLLVVHRWSPAPPDKATRTGSARRPARRRRRSSPAEPRPPAAPRTTSRRARSGRETPG